jgi:hypothetical protein
MIRRVLSLALLCVSAAVSGPPLTTIQDVLYRADGARFNGTLTIAWTTFTAPDRSTVPAQSTTVRVVDGNLRVALVPNSTSSTAATYVVTYNGDGRYQFQENWVVPASVQPLHISDVRIAMGDLVSGAAANDSTGGPIPESGVTGLISDLGARPLKGPGYTAGRTAVINADGLLEGALGALTDCVHVDGSSGPCGATPPSFIDGETPTGLVDGTNTAFGLTAVPDPVSSLTVYRNGMLEKAGFDYNLTGSTLQFVAAAIPQPGDTLLASYRLSGDGTGGDTLGYSSPQVLCSGAGAATSRATLAVLGSCTIPAGVLALGDRIEIRFNYQHSGAAGGFSGEVHWGSTTVLHRDAAAGETLIVGQADAAVVASGAQIGTRNWGAISAFAVSAQMAADSYAGGLSVTFLGSVAMTADSVALSNFTVVRIP